MTVTIVITKAKLGLAVLAAALLVPATAFATHTFSDVPDGQFYTDAVEWAAAHNITTGTSATTFSPNDGVTRAQNVTFAKRYDANIVQPALAALEANVDAIEGLTVGLFDWDGTPDDITTTSLTPTDTGHDASVTIPEGRTGRLLITFGGESACWGGDGSLDWCVVDILVDGVSLPSAGNARLGFDSTDGNSESNQSLEAHSTTRVTGELEAGTYTVAAQVAVTDSLTTFRLLGPILTADVKLTG